MLLTLFIKLINQEKLSAIAIINCDKYSGFFKLMTHIWRLAQKVKVQTFQGHAIEKTANQNAGKLLYIHQHSTEPLISAIQLYHTQPYYLATLFCMA